MIRSSARQFSRLVRVAHTARLQQQQQQQKRYGSTASYFNSQGSLFTTSLSPQIYNSNYYSTSSDTKVKDEFANMDENTWTKIWTEAVSGTRADLHYEESSQQLRTILRSGALKFTDLQEHPERFFLAHRILAKLAPKLGPGFWIRFTVQYNLFAGSVLGMGNPDQIKSLESMQENGILGCFGLTEKLAGVNSGLIINTTATWDFDSKKFILHTPNEAAQKNWISQGYVADKAVIFADLYVGGKSYGGHGFLLDMRKDGQLVEGITVQDMGKKTIGNDLDNASINFDNVKVDKECLLNRFGDVSLSQKDTYIPPPKGIHPMQMIGQRLFSGRVAVAQAALTFTQGLFEQGKQYADSKKCWSPNDSPVLSDIPQLKEIFQEFEGHNSYLWSIVNKCEDELNQCLKQEQIPSSSLIEAIAVAKVECVDRSINMAFRLKQELGSYALMSGSGFEEMDFLQCCKFAEGDSRILKSKMARDRFRAHTKGKSCPPGNDEALWSNEESLCKTIVLNIKQSQEPTEQKKWDAQFKDTDQLTHMTMSRTLKHFL